METERYFAKFNILVFFLKQHFSTLRMSGNVLNKEYLSKLKTNVLNDEKNSTYPCFDFTATSIFLMYLNPVFLKLS